LLKLISIKKTDEIGVFSGQFEPIKTSFLIKTLDHLTNLKLIIHWRSLLRKNDRNCMQLHCVLRMQLPWVP
jgi:hypothetical protein